MIPTEAIALIPAYQPDEKLLRLLKELKAEGFAAVVVNDGSSPECAPIFREAAAYAVVLNHQENKGKGEALKTGLAYIQEHFPGLALVVTADADGQHRTADIVKVTIEAGITPQCLVLGSRRFNEKAPLRSRLGGAITRLVFRLSSGSSVYDTQTGLRAFSAAHIPELLAISGSRYEYEMNMLLEWARAGRPIREIEIETVYLEGNASSHFNPLKDSWRIYREIARFSASSLLSFCLDYGLFCLFGSLGLSVLLSNVAARLLSAGANYSLNRRMVFKSGKAVSRSLPQYAALALFILAANSLILKLLTGAGLNAYLAKLLTEVFLFGFSWFVQHHLVFGKESRHEKS